MGPRYLVAMDARERGESLANIGHRIFGVVDYDAAASQALRTLAFLDDYWRRVPP
jgi:hypothetical protein